MKSRQTVVSSLMIVIAFALVATSVHAQSGDKYRGRLAPVPGLVDGKTFPVANVAGIGSSNAILNGRKLSVSGTFEKMASPATVAHLFMGPLTCVRGQQVFDLTVSKTGDGTSGTIAGTFDLTPQQVDAFKKGRFYVQIHSERAPNGHLMGWLLK